MSVPTSRRLPLFPVISAALLAGVSFWMFATGHVARSFGAIIFALLWLLLTGIWWAMRVKGRKLARLASLVAVIAIIVAGFKLLLRYEGSADGSAMPKFTWKWSETPAPKGIAPAAQPPVDLSSLPAGLAAVHGSKRRRHRGGGRF